MKRLTLGDRNGLVDAVQRDGQPTLHGEELTGVLRVVPETMQDIWFLASLRNQKDKWAPLHGDGLLVKKYALADHVFR